jgi:AcrR family transcriptional regulator
MALTVHDGSNIKKINEILDAAQKRFGNYGFEKTAMHEIAQDLGISKASLYYYYPDKETLFSAVIEKEAGAFISIISDRISQTSNPAELLRIYSDARTDHIRSLLNLSRVRFSDHCGLKNIFEESRLLFREKEKIKILEILNQGKEQGDFEFDDAGALIDLFLDTLRGIALVMKKNRDIAYFNDEDYARLKSQILLFVNIFIKGISK